MQDSHEHSLVDVTTLRHRSLQTTIQLRHSRSCGFWFRESDNRPSCFTEYGDVSRHGFPLPLSVERLQEGEGVLVPLDGLQCGPWTISVRGPNLCVAHEQYAEQSIILDGDGFSLSPAASPIVSLLQLPQPPTMTVRCSRPADFSCAVPSLSLQSRGGDPIPILSFGASAAHLLEA